MNKYVTLHRRKFVKIFASSLLVIPYAKYLWANTGSGNISINMLEQFLANKQDALHEIGKAYLRTAPNEADNEKLFNFIFPENTGANLSHGDNQNERIRAYIQKKSHFDFLSGNTTVVKGWRLATTEARLCALSYLLSIP